MDTAKALNVWKGSNGLVNLQYIKIDGACCIVYKPDIIHGMGVAITVNILPSLQMSIPLAVCHVLSRIINTNTCYSCLCKREQFAFRYNTI